MADIVLGPIIEEMARKAVSYLESQNNWSSDMMDDLENLKTIMMNMRALFSSIERRQITDEQKGFLNPVREAVYEAEDMMDKFEYRRLKDQEDNNRRVRCLAFSTYHFGKRLLGLDNLRRSLSDLLKKLERVESTVQRFLQLAQIDLKEDKKTNVNSEVQTHNLTSSSTSGEAFVARDKEQKEIIGSLLESCNEAESSSTASSAPTVLFIVGDAGAGKTTLAQQIYNHEEIKSKFEIMMWICVSDKFDIMRLTQEILEASHTICDFSLNLNIIQDTLKEKLVSKRFLLVLDNLSDDTKGDIDFEETWTTFLEPLKVGKKGSTVLATTQATSIAEQLSSKERKPVYLGPLNKHNSWLLLEKLAFPPDSADSEEMREFKNIGRQIVQKLNGSPLLLTIIGKRLGRHMDLEEWKHVLTNTLSEKKVTVILTSIYNNLPPNLRRCFSFCSLFPKGWDFQRDKLVHMWIALGLIESQDGTGCNYTRLHREGLGYFEELCSLSFFQTLWRGGVRYYVMHDIMNDLAVSVSKGEYRRIESSDPADMEIPSTVLNISITVSELGRLESMTQLRKLRTLLVINSSKGCLKVPLKDDLFKRLRAVRILDVAGYWMQQLPQVLEPLIHLRYLAFGNSFASLPKILYRLYHLHYLYVYGEYVDITIRDLEVPHIQESGEFHAEKNDQEFKEVDDTNWLQGKLRIRCLEKVEGEKVARTIQLHKKEHIKILNLEWYPSSTTTCENDANVVDALKPHKTLSDLGIKGYRGIRSPIWLEKNWLKRLCSLHLVSCKGWKELPPLGHLPLLKILHIRSMHTVTRVGPRFYGKNGKVKGFPSLEELIFADMPRWVEWTGLQGIQLFPSLKKFEIWKCRRLMGVPAFIPPTLFRKWKADSLRILHPQHVKAIEELLIKNCDELMPARGLTEFSSLRELTIESCSRLLLTYISSEGQFGEGGGLLPPSIVHLEISGCKVTTYVLSRCFQSLTSLYNLTMVDVHSNEPWELDLQHFTSLKVLEIMNCGKLTTFTGVRTLTSLFMLQIISCRELLSLPAEMNCLSSLRVSVFFCCNPVLQRQFDERKGPQWNKFAFVNINSQDVDAKEFNSIFLDTIRRTREKLNSLQIDRSSSCRAR